ncbi:type II toxin-antitoxin system RelE/ParE family toxin [Leucothrix pacifica]|uniref:Type II toxin-antitoxin system RelE/ParE family toxin n=1 Tax=Leucothrix pacifica TaxID=1247513 RepID=A0A317CDY9_9GAMM|nr:type II toxin-antitoxin system RelE/ParE family toxin [Leucothrix pacifica]PWQ96905.1 type II toxin-antitoxin system RelE/ParE family toxin [Leucothrix pacifica]
MTVRITEDAKTDIRKIYIYSYENFGEIKADEYVDALDAKLMDLPNVLSSTDYGFVRDGLMRSNYQSHAIYYRIEASDVIVLRVLHQRMDPARHIDS